jgi:DeoR/GlpR family transcriptional regulator of sugar metabolism
MLDYAAFPQQRQARIRQLLQENGRVVCAELASQMQVSEHTIRRDLQELSIQAYAKRSTAARYYSCRKPGIFTAAK